MTPRDDTESPALGLFHTARKTRKSPLTVLARTTTVGPASSPGVSDSGTSELSSPEADPASTSILVPGAIPSWTSPETLCTVTLPSRSEPMRTSPETDFTDTEPSTESAATLPETVLTVRLPVTRGKRTSPLTVLAWIIGRGFVHRVGDGWSLR